MYITPLMMYIHDLATPIHFVTLQQFGILPCPQFIAHLVMDTDSSRGACLVFCWITSL